MITLRRDGERRHVRRFRRQTWQTFFPTDASNALAGGFGALTLLDEIRLPPGGSATLDTADEAEIITYVYAGGLAYQDSTGNSGVLHAGEFQVTCTGRGIRHEEANASQTDWAHIIHISLRPAQVGLKCAREQNRFTAAQRRNLLCFIASPDGRKGSLRLAQDTLVYSSILDPGHHAFVELPPGRSAWLHVLSGEVTLNGLVLTQGDGVGITFEPSVSLTAGESAEILLVNLGAGQSPRITT